MQHHLPRTTIVLLIALIAASAARAQWRQAGGLAAGHINAVLAIDSAIITASASGIHRTTDGGHTWEQGYGLDRNTAARLVHIGSLFFALSNGSVYRSSDAGATWTKTSQPPSAPPSTVQDLIAVGTRLVVSSGGFQMEGAVSVSTDSGATWTRSRNGIADSNLVAVVAKGSDLYVASNDAASNRGHVYRSTDGGINWTQRAAGLPETIYSTVMAVAGGTIYLGAGDGLYRTTDDGASWTKIGSLPANNVNAVLGSGSDLWVGYTGGFAHSTDGGVTWGTIAGPMRRRGVTTLTQRGDGLLVGTNSGLFTSEDRGATWHSIGLPVANVRALAVHRATLYAGTADGLFISKNGGKDWEPHDVVDTNDEYGPSVNAILVTYSTMYVGGSRLYISNDDGGTWIRTNDQLQGFPINAILVREDTIYLGTSDGMIMSPDGGGSWHALSVGDAHSGIQSITRTRYGIFASTVRDEMLYRHMDGDGGWTRVIIGDDAGGISIGAKVVYADGNGLYVGSSSGIFRSTDDGATWQNLTGNLANHNVVSIVSDATSIYIATANGGAHRSTDGGQTWTAINDGLVSLNASAIALNNVYLEDPTEYGLGRMPSILALGTSNASASFLSVEDQSSTPWPDHTLTYAVTGASTTPLATTNLTAAELHLTASSGTGTMTVMRRRHAPYRPLFPARAPRYVSHYGWTIGEVGIRSFEGELWIKLAELNGGITDPKGVIAYRSASDVNFVYTGLPTVYDSATNTLRIMIDRSDNIILGSDVDRLLDAPTDRPIAGDLDLEPNIPNPFSSSTTIRYRLAARAHVRIAIADVRGRELAVIADGVEEAGMHSAGFDATGLPSGVYLCTVRAGASVREQRVVVAR